MKSMSKSNSRARAIREKCIVCSCGIVSEVRRCPVSKCPLYPYRMGYIDSSLTRNTSDTVCVETPKKHRDF